LPRFFFVFKCFIIFSLNVLDYIYGADDVTHEDPLMTQCRRVIADVTAATTVVMTTLDDAIDAVNGRSGAEARWGQQSLSRKSVMDWKRWRDWPMML